MYQNVRPLTQHNWLRHIRVVCRYPVPGYPDNNLNTPTLCQDITQIPDSLTAGHRQETSHSSTVTEYASGRSVLVRTFPVLLTSSTSFRCITGQSMPGNVSVTPLRLYGTALQFLLSAIVRHLTEKAAYPATTSSSAHITDSHSWVTNMFHSHNRFRTSRYLSRNTQVLRLSIRKMTTPQT